MFTARPEDGSFYGSPEASVPASRLSASAIHRFPEWIEWGRCMPAYAYRRA